MRNPNLQTPDGGDATLFKRAQRAPMTLAALDARRTGNRARTSPVNDVEALDLDLIKRAQRRGSSSLSKFDQGRNTNLRKRDPGAAVSTIHARIHSADEDEDGNRTFTADLDEAGGLDYRRSADFFHADDGPVHFGNNQGKHVGQITHIRRNKRDKAVHLAASCHDDDEWKKIKSGVYSHLAIETKPGPGGAQVPGRVHLTDSKVSHKAERFLTLRKRDGSVERVPFITPTTMAIGKRESLDVFKVCTSPRRAKDLIRA
jgi:hypothetical protein